MQINQATLDWVAKIRPHWVRCNGNVHGDSKFWNECIHGVSHDTWLELVKSYRSIVQDHNWVSSAYPKLDEDMYEVFWRASWHDEESGAISERPGIRAEVTIPHNKEGYNKPVFRAVMAFKDLLGQVTGQPFIDYTKPKTVKRNKPTQAEVLAKYEELGRVINELFE